MGDYGDHGRGPVWWLPKEIMWDDANKPSVEELEQMKRRLCIELEKCFSKAYDTQKNSR